MKKLCEKVSGLVPPHAVLVDPSCGIKVSSSLCSFSVDSLRVDVMDLGVWEVSNGDIPLYTVDRRSTCVVSILIRFIHPYPRRYASSRALLHFVPDSSTMGADSRLERFWRMNRMFNLSDVPLRFVVISTVNSYVPSFRYSAMKSLKDLKVIWLSFWVAS